MNFQEFKQMAHEFFTLSKTMRKPEQVESGFKALGISFLHLKCTDQERWQASVLLDLASKMQDDIALCLG